MADSRSSSATPLFLPREIWWIVAKEFAARRDFGSLFNCALVDKGLARLALPLLYSIHELSPASALETTQSDSQVSVGLWRSIIASSLGKTFYPYCLYIKSLRLGDLQTLIEDLTAGRESYKHLRVLFFSPPLDRFEIQRTGPVTRRYKGSLIDVDAIVIEVADKITEFIKSASEVEDKTVTLANLEGQHLPRSKLPTWVSRLSKLTSLSIRDGSVLNSDVARAIRENCPAFKEVVCFYCKGTDVDQDLASFFLGLAPNTLQSFTVTSANEIGEAAFKALGSQHASSIKALSLQSLERPAFESLNELSACRSIERLDLEASMVAQHFEWKSQVKQVFQEVVEWLKQCASLKVLEMSKVPNATKLLGEMFKSPLIRLKTLDVRLVDSSEEFYASLGLQTELESLTVLQVTEDDALDVVDQRHVLFVDSICSCPELRELDLMDEPLTVQDLGRISELNPKLESLSFSGDVGDEVMPVLAKLPYLKMLNFNALTSFTFDGLLRFIQGLGTDENAAHYGIQIILTNQFGGAFSEDEEAMLQNEVARLYDGRIEITYFPQPDEHLHESDFSD